MKKTVPLIVSAVAIVALLAPAAAQAEGALITNSQGEAVETIIATNEGLEIATALGTLECATASLHIALTTNATTTVHGHGAGSAKGTAGTAPHVDHCGTGGVQFYIPSVIIDTLQLAKHNGETTGTANITIAWNWTTISGAADCIFSGAAVAVVRTGPDTINIAGGLTRSGGSSLCFNEVLISGGFTLLDENLAPVVIH